MKFLWGFVIFFTVAVEVRASKHHHHHHCHNSHRHLFVFGDSYADTGNINKHLANSWKSPYGDTFPGKPTGRFSDGRVLTDFIARFENIRTPITYGLRNFNKNIIENGINFAYGGTGVFDTNAPFPNLTAQVKLFEGVVKEGKYTPCDIQRSMALVSVAGNDYFTWYERNNGSLAGIEEFIHSLVDKLLEDIIGILDLGVKKVAVVGLPPLGCVPEITINYNYQGCNKPINLAVQFHNALLRFAVGGHSKKFKQTQKVVYLDLYSAFTSILQSSGSPGGKSKFGPDPLKPCCAPISKEYACGEVDVSGTKLYTVCEHPESAFFWDLVHPTQMGWTAVSSALKPIIRSLFF